MGFRLGQLQWPEPVITRDPTAREGVEAIIHDREFQGIPSSFRTFEPIGTGNLPTQLLDNSLHDVSSAGYLRMIYMCPEM